MYFIILVSYGISDKNPRNNINQNKQLSKHIPTYLSEIFISISSWNTL